mmetsp:Transcript_13338/g.48556  ORF Transcript_13338/g.48556 Transcript_13338/m.48556 type:complete len:564 (-) Transcript_13338:28-1719(-)
MRAQTIQIVWHEKKPIYSVDFSNVGLLATGGADSLVTLWKPTKHEDGLPSVEHYTSLSYHTSPTVNIVRFSPNGKYLASGGDGGELLLWHQAQGPAFGEDEGEGPPWKIFKVLRGHSKEGDVFDVAWAPDSDYLVSASVDNTCIVWSIEKDKPIQVLSDHKHYVQGVAWDPRGKYVATQSSDRTCRIYNSFMPPKKKPSSAVKLACQSVIAKFDEVDPLLAGDDDPLSEVKAIKHFLFQDDQNKAFFRRLAWSPDGSFLVTPAGQFVSKGAILPAAFVFGRKRMATPALHLPTLTSVVAVRFCPRLFRASMDNETGFKLPYKLVFAMATLDTVLVYDTDSKQPLGLVAGLHPSTTPLTDLTWSDDGSFLAVSSEDGYCSIITFDVEGGELGEPMPQAQQAELEAKWLAVNTRHRCKDSGNCEGKVKKSDGQVQLLTNSEEKNAAVNDSQGKESAPRKRLTLVPVSDDPASEGPKRRITLSPLHDDGAECKKSEKPVLIPGSEPAESETNALVVAKKPRVTLNPVQGSQPVLVVGGGGPRKEKQRIALAPVPSGGAGAHADSGP